MRNVQMVLNRAEIIISDKGEVFRCDKERLLIKQLAPYLENEFLELYVLSFAQEIVYLLIDISNGKRKMLGHTIRGCSEPREYKLFGKDYAFGKTILGPFGRTELWALYSPDGLGGYDNVTERLLKGSCICMGIEKIGKVYKFTCQCYKNSRKYMYAAKQDGLYQLIDKETAEKLMKQPQDEKKLSGWRSFSELGFGDIDLIFEKK